MQSQYIPSSLSRFRCVTNNILCPQTLSGTIYQDIANFCRRSSKMYANPETESFMHHRMVLKETDEKYLPDFMKQQLTTGTTTVAFAFDGGVVMGTDSRTSMGSFVASRVTDKIDPITDRIFACRAGSAADTQAIADIAAHQLNFLEMETNERPLVKTAANIFRDLCYNYRDQLTTSFIIAGWDKQHGGQVFAIPLGGLLQQNPWVIAGSGSTYCYGYVDRHYKPNMTKEECLEFVKDILTLAMTRDGSSGGIMNLAIITENSVERFKLTGKDMPSYYKG